MPMLVFGRLNCQKNLHFIHYLYHTIWQVFKRLPFGITSTPEFFQQKMSNILKDLDGVVCMIDDVFIYGSTQEEHDQRLEIVLNKLHKAGVTLNRSKCKFSTSSV